MPRPDPLGLLPRLDHLDLNITRAENMRGLDWITINKAKQSEAKKII